MTADEQAVVARRWAALRRRLTQTQRETALAALTEALARHDADACVRALRGAVEDLGGLWTPLPPVN